VSALEEELGVRLLLRSSKGVTSTSAGKTFLQHRTSFWQMSSAPRWRCAKRDRGRAAVWRSGYPPRCRSVRLCPSFAPVASGCRKVRLKIVEAYSDYLKEWLQSGRLDVAILFSDRPESGLRERALLDEQLVFYQRKGGLHFPRSFHSNGSRMASAIAEQRACLRRVIEDACAPACLQLNWSPRSIRYRASRATERASGTPFFPLGSVAQEVAAGKLQWTNRQRPDVAPRGRASNIMRPQTAASSAVIALVEEVIQTWWFQVLAGH